MSGAANDGCPVKHETSGCPIKQDISNDIKLKEEYNAAAGDLVFSQAKQPGQTTKLSVERTISTIPKGDFSPSHQPEDFTKWVYPSEQQYYNAMKKKGYNPDEKDVGVILAIHNVVNEQGWSQVKEWEKQRGCDSPKLVRFMGRPQDISPKAYLLNLLGHDWTVDSNGAKVRYVIDFYTGSTVGVKAPISLHLDVRPAIDSPQDLYYRLKYNMFRFLPTSWTNVFAFSEKKKTSINTSSDVNSSVDVSKSKEKIH